MSGIPELETHFAGLEIHSKVILQAKDTTTFKLAVSYYSTYFTIITLIVHLVI